MTFSAASHQGAIDHVIPLAPRAAVTALSRLLHLLQLQKLLPRPAEYSGLISQMTSAE